MGQRLSHLRHLHVGHSAGDVAVPAASRRDGGGAAVAVTATAAHAIAVHAYDDVHATLHGHDMHALALVSPHEYATFCALAYDDKAKLPSGWSILLNTSQCQLDREGYSAVAYVHIARRLCVVAQRGTADVFGLRAALWLHFDEFTVQLCLAEQFSRLVRQRLAARARHMTHTHTTKAATASSSLSLPHKSRTLHAGDNATSSRRGGGDVCLRDNDDEEEEAATASAATRPCRAGVDKHHSDGEQDMTGADAEKVAELQQRDDDDDDDSDQCDVDVELAARVDIGDWRLSYTGHSLGALVATYRAAREDVLAVTFESAGGRSFLQHTLDARALAAARVNTVSYVCAPNPINTLRAHIGLVVLVPVTLDPQLPHMTAAGGMSLLPSSLPPLQGTQAQQPQTQLASSALSTSLTTTSAAAANNNNNNNNASNSSVTGGAGEALPLTSTVSSSGAEAAAASSSSWRTRLAMPSLRVPAIRSYAMTYTRDYMLSSVGVPELQQYITRIEPMVRAMLEQTCQMHTVLNFVRYFASQQQQQQQQQQPQQPQQPQQSQQQQSQQPSLLLLPPLPRDDGAAAGEALVLRWPSGLMQFIEYCNAARALCDAEARTTATVRDAYAALLRRVYATTPLQPRRLPLRYVSAAVRTLLRLWRVHVRALTASHEASATVSTTSTMTTRTMLCVREVVSALQLTQLDVKVLNAVTLDERGGGALCCAAPLTALQAKMYLTMLVSRSSTRHALETAQQLLKQLRRRTRPDKDAATIVTSKL